MQSLTVLSLLFATTLASPALRTRAGDCAVAGWDKGTSAYSYSTKSGSADACGASCAAASKCKSFAVGEGACLLYTKTVAQNVDSDSSSPYTFYDKGCVAGSPSSAPSSSRRAASATGRVSSVRVSSASRQSTRAPTQSTVPTSGNCNLAGYDKGSPEAFYYSKKAANANYAACSALCTKKSCKSFAVGGGECLLYEAAVTGNFDAEAGSPYRFFDVACIAGVASSAASETPSATPSETPSETPSVTPSETASETPSQTASVEITSSAVESTPASSIVPESNSVIASSATESATESASSVEPTISGTPSSSWILDFTISSVIPSATVAASNTPVVSSSAVVSSASVAEASSTTASAPATSSSASAVCGAKVSDFTSPELVIKPILTTFLDQTGCETVCVLTSCKSIVYYTGQCFVFYEPAANLHATYVETEEEVPKISELSCFSANYPSPSSPELVQPVDANPICAQDSTSVDIKYATFAVKSAAAGQLEACKGFCDNLNCGSYGSSPSGCILFNNTASAVGDGPAGGPTITLYDRGCN